MTMMMMRVVAIEMFVITVCVIDTGIAIIAVFTSISLA